MSDEITEKEKLCVYCGKTNKADASDCVNCGYKWENIKEVKGAVSRDFGTLMLIGHINSFLGWLMVGGFVIAIIISLVLGNIVVALIGAAAIPICLLVVASGQVISCFVSIERNTKDTSDMLRDILDPSQQEEGKEN